MSMLNYCNDLPYWVLSRYPCSISSQTHTFSSFCQIDFKSSHFFSWEKSYILSCLLLLAFRKRKLIDMCFLGDAIFFQNWFFYTLWKRPLISYSYNFFIQIYSDICLYWFFYTNIFGWFIPPQWVKTSALVEDYAPTVEWNSCCRISRRNVAIRGEETVGEGN